MDWHGFPAMGTTVAVLGTPCAAQAAQELFAAFETRFSRFRPNSELSCVNRDPRPSLEVSPALAAVLHTADEARARTDGLVDPAVGSAVAAWGYDRTFRAVEDQPAPPPCRPAPLPRRPHWTIDGTILHRPPGTTLDLGGLVKGWAADQAVHRTKAWAVNAGGDLRSRHPELSVRIRDPWGGCAGTVTVGIGGLATSSTTLRSWSVGGERVHHLVDPRSGRPVETPVLQATVLAETAVAAEIGAKAMILRGRDALVWASGVSWITGGLACWQDGSVVATSKLAVAA